MSEKTEAALVFIRKWQKSDKARMISLVVGISVIVLYEWLYYEQTIRPTTLVVVTVTLLQTLFLPLAFLTLIAPMLLNRFRAMAGILANALF